MDVGHPVMGFLLWSQMSESFRFLNPGILKLTADATLLPVLVSLVFSFVDSNIN